MFRQTAREASICVQVESVTTTTKKTNTPSLEETMVNKDQPRHPDSYHE